MSPYDKAKYSRLESELEFKKVALKVRANLA